MGGVARPVEARDGDLVVPGPGGSRLLVEWFRKGGVFSTDRRVEEDRATHARVTEQRVDGSTVVQRILPTDDVASFVAERRTVWQSGPLDTPHAVPVAGFASRCPYCDTTRAHRGQLGFVERVSLGVNLSFNEKRTTFEAYDCPRCGSVELFVPGIVTHPCGE